MEEKEYENVFLFMGVLTTIGFPEDIKISLEEMFGEIKEITNPFPFSYTDYYVPEMGDGIERFFILFKNLVKPDILRDAKVFTNKLEEIKEKGGKRKINLDPGILSDANIVLATTKNRAHRIAIGSNLYAELTLMYKDHKYSSFPWTYSDFQDDKVQGIFLSWRKELLSKRRNEKLH